jgi:hypothetical protein
VHAILGGWSLDAFVLARSAPPTDIIGAVCNGVGVSLYPRPNLNPGVPLELFGWGYPGGKIFNKAAFVQPPPDGRPISSVTSCAGSTPRSSGTGDPGPRASFNASKVPEAPPSKPPIEKEAPVAPPAGDSSGQEITDADIPF